MQNALIPIVAEEQLAVGYHNSGIVVVQAKTVGPIVEQQGRLERQLGPEQGRHHRSKFEILQRQPST